MEAGATAARSETLAAGELRCQFVEQLAVSVYEQSQQHHNHAHSFTCSPHQRLGTEQVFLIVWDAYELLVWLR